MLLKIVINVRPFLSRISKTYQRNRTVDYRLLLPESCFIRIRKLWLPIPRTLLRIQLWKEMLNTREQVKLHCQKCNEIKSFENCFIVISFLVFLIVITYIWSYIVQLNAPRYMYNEYTLTWIDWYLIFNPTLSTLFLFLDV